METGIKLIAKERKRQIKKLGYDKEYDSKYKQNLLGEAAAAYATTDPDRKEFWPWNESYWKPTPENRVKELIKAGALIAAAIDYELNKNL